MSDDLIGLGNKAVADRRDAVEQAAQMQTTSDHRLAAEQRAGYIDALVADYTALRNERQNVDIVLSALIGTAYLIATALGGYLLTSCNFGTHQCKAGIWPPLYAFLPLGPLGLIALFAQISSITILRSYYLRAVEEQLQEQTGAPFIHFREAKLILPSFVHIVDSAIYSPRTGIARFRVLVALLFIIVSLLFGSTTGASLWFAQPVDLQVGMGLIYLIISALLLRLLWSGTIGGGKLWRQAAVLGLQQPNGPQVRRRSFDSERRLLSYILLPRPGDLVSKGWLIPFGWFLKAFATGSASVEGWWSVICFTAVFELLIYQARYTINDLRDMEVDARYSEFKRRTRFPLSSGPAGVRAAVLAAALRLALAVWIAVRVVDPSIGAVLLVAAGLVVLHTVVYEAVRKKISLNPGPNLVAMTPIRVFVLAFVGGGSALRVCVGLILAQAGAPDWMLVGIAAAWMTVLSSMSVSMAWTLDAISQVSPVKWSAFPTPRYLVTLERIGHVDPLLRQARLLSKDNQSLRCIRRVPAGYEKQLRVLSNLRLLDRISTATWWNSTLVVSAMLAAVVALSIAGDYRATRLFAASTIGVVTSLCAIWLYGGDTELWVGRRIFGSSSWVRALVPFVAGSMALAVLAATTNVRASYVAWVPLAFLGAVYLSFRHGTRNAMLLYPPAAARGFLRLLMRVAHKVLEVVLDRQATILLEGKQSDSRR